MSQYAQFSKTSPELAAVIARLPPSPLLGDIQTVRNVAEAMFRGPQAQDALKRILPPDSTYTVHDHKVPVDGGEILVRGVIPTFTEGEDGTFPLLVWYHPGGFALGDIDQSDAILRALSVNQRISTLNVEYRLSPENPFPAGHDDCYHALKWAAENASLLNASLGKGFVVAGQSSGGNLAGSVALRAAEDPFFEGRKLTGQCLQIPSVVHPSAWPEKYRAELLSFEQNKDAPILGTDAMLQFLEWLGAPADHPHFSILLHSAHAKAPPAYIQVAGFDPLRDEGILYAKVLEEAGVKVQCDVYAGLPHGGHQIFPTLDVSRKFQADFVSHLPWLFKGGKVVTEDSDNVLKTLQCIDTI
ncbi:hypothetical protein NLI96_g4022 [Meripilus lineatus]|uniref:Alpha/beta hydrolase fold-3 domain-containing protein n=1 Tax=Meripilus lineatus TaxID=2056292 RepID=A0AAD5V7R0_9APHY|nr:hypothetical protein NLI96_g4022 [Physisporinus lineatus]